ncbi:MAG: YabP/YqfC family sporulation protein [Christensenellales bacterium]
MEQNKKEVEKTFQNSELTLLNRQNLKVSGVEKVYESNPQRLQLKVAGSIMIVIGTDLNVARLDTSTGVIEVVGKVDSIKYTSTTDKSGLFKRLFK